jgi:uncharacterized protein YecE (DUF72 family)
VRDCLRYVAGFVDVIEVNSTFYRPPDARTVRSWEERTADLPGFKFTAKLHQDITHRGRVEPSMVRSFHDGLAPLTDSGRLSHLLAQFRYDFEDTPDSRRHLKLIGDSFGGMTNLALELRHRSWLESGAQAWLEELGVTVANLDYPLSRDGFDREPRAIGRHAYMRLHGRNAAAWFSKDAGRDQTYNYLYHGGELDEIARRATKLAGMSASLTMIANNHYQGKEAVNILQIKSMITKQKLRVPPMLLERYPELSEAADSSSVRGIAPRAAPELPLAE